AGFSSFIDPETAESYANKLHFLRNIKRISVNRLDELYQETSGSDTGISSKLTNDKLLLQLDNALSLNRTGITRQLINFLKEELNFANSEYIIKKKTGRNTFGTDRYFKLIEETENEVIIPRGFAGKLIRYCKEHGIDHDFRD